MYVSLLINDEVWNEEINESNKSTYFVSVEEVKIFNIKVGCKSKVTNTQWGYTF